MRTERQRIVRAALQRRRKNQRWLAEQIGVTPAYLSQLLSGKRRGSLPVVMAISRETGIKVADLAVGF